MTNADHRPASWYRHITSYQWLVLVIASAGWVFDVYESQIFNITRGTALPELLKLSAEDPQLKAWGDRFLGIFLVGGTIGGVLFGSLADRYGRRPIMVATILTYAFASGLMFFVQNGWQAAAVRLVVALGVGGEWAVAASLVNEVFPQRARAQAAGIFHSTSVLGTWLATLAGMLVGANWRFAYLLGVLPALLIVAVRAWVHEPESWRQLGTATASGKQRGSFRALFTDPQSRRHAVLGLILAAVGLGAFWGVTVAGQDLARESLLRAGVADEQARSRSQFAYGFIETAGGAAGLLAFGPLAARLGRRAAFALFHLASLVVVPLTCFWPQSYGQLLWLLPLYGFFTLGMHAGYAIYFPELFPTHLRATGAGLCFNGGRIVAATMMLLSGWVKSRPDMPLEQAIAWLSLVFVVGLAVLPLLPETKDQPLPE